VARAPEVKVDQGHEPGGREPEQFGITQKIIQQDYADNCHTRSGVHLGYQLSLLPKGQKRTQRSQIHLNQCDIFICISSQLIIQVFF
jgi:hypothetical protein